MILNGIIVYALRKLKKTHIISQWFILCLSTSDTFIGVIGFISHIFRLIFCFLDSCSTMNYFQKILLLLIVLLEQFSAILIFIISFDRCLRIKYPRKYNTWMTKNKAYVFVSINFLISVQINVFRAYYALNSPKKYITVIIVNHIINLTCLILTYTLYISFYLSVKSEVNTNTKLSITARNLGRWLPRNTAKVKDVESGSDRLKDKYSSPESVRSDVVLQSQAGHARIEVYPDVKQADVIEQKSTVKEQDVDEGNDGNIRELGTTVMQLKDKREENLRKAIFCILFALTLCYTPSLLTDLITRMKGNTSENLQIYLGITITLNSSLNAIILIAYSKDLRKFVKSLVLKNQI